MKYIKLSKGYEAIVDDCNFEWLNQWKWHYNNHGYAMRRQYLGKKDGIYKYKGIYMHNLINKTPIGFETDHINRNKLDNRKENLRTVNESENKINTGLRIDNNSGVKGVSFNKKQNKWVSSITVKKKVYYLGIYLNFRDACLARINGEKQYAKI